MNGSFIQVDLRRALRAIPLLKVSLYLLIEVHRTLSDDALRDRREVDRSYRQPDPWRDAAEEGEEYLARATAMLLSVLPGGKFDHALDVGCAQGAFAEKLIPYCGALTGLDLSPVAIARAEQRRRWPENFHFATWDLRSSRLPEDCDLVVVAGVLEYVHGPRTMKVLRSKLVDGVRPGGYLQIGTTRANPVVEASWFGKLLRRGRWINVFFGEHPELTVVEQHSAPTYELTLYRKSAAKC